MITFYSNLKRDIRSQTLGPHSYTKFQKADVPPQEDKENISVIKKYAGQHGSVKRIHTI